MPRKSKTDEEIGFMRTAWEELEEQAVEYRFKTDLYITPTISRGVWHVTITGESMELDGKGHPVWRERVQYRWPNGFATTFAGELWAKLHKFTEQCAEARDRITRAQIT